jgi:hypothetical protein
MELRNRLDLDILQFVLSVYSDRTAQFLVAGFIRKFLALCGSTFQSIDVRTD